MMQPALARKDVDCPAVRPDVRAELSIGAHDLRELLRGIREEDCAHTWKNFPLDGTPDELLAWENSRRPTTVFFYHAPAPDTRSPELAAVATAADAISHEFPFRGFPVLARCYIKPKFRRQGLYRALVRHRLEFCLERFGSSLSAVHMGTAEDSVATTIARLGGDWPPFLQMGKEALHVGDDVRHVGGYVLFMPDYAARITASLAGEAAPPEIAVLRARVERLLSGQPCEEGDYYNTLSGGMARALAATDWFAKHDPRPLEQLLELCRSIPLVTSTEADH